jgi:ADP-ribose pyrophosphatase YjhB (NUDIX family)
VDEADRVLLCRFDLPSQGVVVWAAPGGGVERGETPFEALVRELDEEVGLALETEPPLVWHQRIVAPGHAEGYDGVVNDYYLVKVNSFVPAGSLGAELLRSENITNFRWWALDALETYRGEDIFAPRDLAALTTQLLRDGIPEEPLALGL